MTSSKKGRDRDVERRWKLIQTALLIALGTILLLQLRKVMTLDLDPAVTDLGRDLIGAEATRLGLTPYQTLPALASHIDSWGIHNATANWWVAHTPFSIGFARLWLGAFGSYSETAFEVLSVISALSFGLALAFIASRWWGKKCGTAIGFLVLLSFGLASDVVWLHGGAVAAVCLVAVYSLEAMGQRPIALVFLGILVAWKPWLAPLALFLPARKNLVRDVGVVGATAIALNVAAAQWLGGLYVLSDWFSVAVPANFQDPEFNTWNLGPFVGFIDPSLRLVFFLGVSALALIASRFVRRTQWPLLGVLVIGIASPLVWLQYWLTLSAPIVFGFREGRAAGLVSVLAALSVLPSEIFPVRPRVLVWVALVVLTLEVLRARTFSGQPPSEAARAVAGTG